MGTQQILLIVLSVIIVGVAIVVGITMFRNQAIKSNAQALAAEATNLRTEMVQWYKTPIDQGGGGQAALADLNEAGLFTSLGANTDGEITRDNIGKFVITVPTIATATITASGIEKNGDDDVPTFTVVFDLSTGEVGSATPGFGDEVF